VSEKTDMAQALRERAKKWRNRYGVYVNGRPSLTTDNCIHDIKSLLAAHESRAQPANTTDEQVLALLKVAIEKMVSVNAVYERLVSAQPASVGDGWVMVPRELLEAIEDGSGFGDLDPRFTRHNRYHKAVGEIRQLLAAAPQPPAKESE